MYLIMDQCEYVIISSIQLKFQVPYIDIFHDGGAKPTNLATDITLSKVGFAYPVRPDNQVNVFNNNNNNNKNIFI